MASKGKLATPKHTALSMAVRHLSGSAQLIGLLNGLGHCTSVTSVLEHDTALAKRQLLLGENPVPEGVRVGVFTTIVWDNIDFGEETLSGKGTTHGTSGIIIQPGHCFSSHHPFSSGIHATQMKTRERTLQTTSPNIATYFGGKQQGP